jgi:LemA protein
MSTEPAAPPRPVGRGLLALAALAVLVIALGIWFVAAGNRLVALQENVNTAWAQVETVLQRRFDLIPNLVATVKGYAEHEKEILEEVTRLRSQWGQAKTVDEKAQVGSQLEGVLSRLLVVSENYPDLKANQNFRDLQVELSGTENRVAVERQRYNEVVRTYNTAVRQFPTSLVASLRGFTTDKTYFEGSPQSQEAPKVDFSKPS